MGQSVTNPCRCLWVLVNFKVFHSCYKVACSLEICSRSKAPWLYLQHSVHEQCSNAPLLCTELHLDRGVVLLRSLPERSTSCNTEDVTLLNAHLHWHSHNKARHFHRSNQNSVTPKSLLSPNQISPLVSHGRLFLSSSSIYPNLKKPSAITHSANWERLLS